MAYSVPAQLTTAISRSSCSTRRIAPGGSSSSGQMSISSATAPGYGRHEDRRMPALHIRLLGGFSVEIDGTPVDERAWRLRKARSLVKLLALAPGRHVHRDV